MNLLKHADSRTGRTYIGFLFFFEKHSSQANTVPVRGAPNTEPNNDATPLAIIGLCFLFLD